MMKNGTESSTTDLTKFDDVLVEDVFRDRPLGADIQD
jgi:hypothetical protein